VSADTIAAISLLAFGAAAAAAILVFRVVIPGRREGMERQRHWQEAKAEADRQRQVYEELARRQQEASRKRLVVDPNRDAASLLEEGKRMAEELFGPAGAPVVDILASAPHTPAGFADVVRQLEEMGPPVSVDHRRFGLFMKVIQGDSAGFNVGLAIASEPGWEERLQSELGRLGPDPDRDWTAGGILRVVRHLVPPSMTPDLVRMARGFRATRQLEREGLHGAERRPPA
jgi:hypothetical protein